MRKILFGTILAVAVAAAAFPFVGDALAQTVPAPIITPAPAGGFIVSAGSAASTLIEWLLVPMVPAIGIALAGLIMQLAKGVGLAIDEQRRAKLQAIIENGIKWAAHDAEILLNGKLNFEMKNQLIDLVVSKYLPQHGAETVKALGGDVTNTGAMLDIVTARSATILATSIDAPKATAGSTTVVVPAPAAALPQRGV
jgi:hypothetical protein